MHYNFEFLKKHKDFKDFTNACIEAEKSTLVAYSTTAILTRRALELAVKWVYAHDQDLTVPYQDNLSTLIHDHTFRNIIDVNLFPKLQFIRKLGNLAVHSKGSIPKEQAVQALKNLFEFVDWIHYSYATEYEDVKFDETLLNDSEEQRKTQQELKNLFEKLGSKDRKLSELIAENEELRRIMSEARRSNTQTREFNVEEISEFKTRKLYIDLELKLAGWDIGTNCIEELEVEGMPNATGKGYVDYVLYDDAQKPIAVIEAKKASVDPRNGKVQAIRYADCIEKQCGRRPIIFYTNGFEYYIIDADYGVERRIAGFYTKQDLEWLIHRTANKQPLKNVAIKDEITNRDYQKIAIEKVCETFMQNRRKALLVMATGSGKTRTAISLVDVLLNKGWIKKALFLADRKELVKQAKNSFKALMPHLSLCNLLDSKDNPDSRMVFSTYPTMMNAIDSTKTKDGNKLFSIGHFDLIIIDESHRSIYKKYQAIFDYFDASLVGLTATPKSDIDKNTFSVFELEDNVPTFSYELGEAIEEKYLVPFHTIETEMKFLEEGIKYDELSEDEKEEFEDTFDCTDDRGSEELNTFLFNKSTVDHVLRKLMNEGIKVEGGDKVGKTIIFAKNKKHAKFIQNRFDKIYPQYNNGFMQEVYTDIKYVDSVIDYFKIKEKNPQITVSVDMLDTGIDVPEILNLVFFKNVRSKTKFWQMIGRGTRLCEDLFGIGLNKECFRIFDYCGNFEFFRQNKNEKEAKLSKSLTEKLFLIKVKMIKELQNIKYQTDEFIDLRNELVTDVLNQIKNINENRFDSRMKLRYIHKYRGKLIWQCIDDIVINELDENICTLIQVIEDDELAKRFDYLMYTIEYAELQDLDVPKSKWRVVETAYNLADLGTIPQVKAQEEIILKLTTDEFWKNATIFNYEEVRSALRALIQFISGEPKKIYYTDFDDEITKSVRNEGVFTVNAMNNYRKKVNAYLTEHRDDLVVYKLRNNKEISDNDIKHLESILWHDLGTEDDYHKEYGNEPLLALVTKIVGFEPEAANAAFSEFLSDNSLNSNQMEFVRLVVRFIIKNGFMDKVVLNEQPFNRFGSITDLFKGRIEVVKQVVKKIDEINERINVG
jgi:type I restriction enzyme R subunit